MPSCRACGHQIPFLDGGGRLPPWCSHCGKDLQLADEPPPPSARLDDLRPEALDPFPLRAVQPSRVAVSTSAEPETVIAEPVDEPVDLITERLTPARPKAPATTPAPSWSQITCLACGCVYRCRVEPAARGAGEDWWQWDQIEGALCPCPTCGLVQPDRAFRAKVTRHLLLTLGSLVVLGVVLVLGWTHLLPIDAAAVLGGVVSAVVALVHVHTALLNPNRDRAANRVRAEAEVSAGKVEETTPGSDRPRAKPRNLNLGHWLALGVVVAAVPLFLAPTALSTLSGWPRNSVSPGILGPGDKVRVYFSNVGVKSLNGFWVGGGASVELYEPHLREDPGKVEVETSSWMGMSTSFFPEIQIEPGDAPREPAPYVTLTLPDNPALSGRTVRLHVRMNLEYPVQTSSTTFGMKDTQVEESLTLRLAGPHAASRLSWLSTVSLLLGTLGSVVGGFALLSLARWQRSLALPSAFV
jgi:hypothetical protein